MKKAYLISFSLLFISGVFYPMNKNGDSPLSKTIRLYESKWYDLQLKYEKEGKIAEFPVVNISMQYDQDSLRFRALVKDNHFKDSERGWRYGDGFLINFAFPSDEDSTDTENFYAYGFSLENKKTAAVLVNKDGSYFLKKQEQYSPKIFTDTLKHEAKYYISLPWKALYPFQPLLDKTAGINIIYVSQNEDRSRIILKYIDDPYYDTEITKKRRFAKLEFLPSDLSKEKLSCEMESRLQMGNKTGLTLALFSKTGTSAEINYEITDTSGNIIIKNSFAAELTEGRNIIKKEIPIPETEGIYNLTVNQVSPAGKISWSDSFYRLDSAKLHQFKEDIELFKNKKGSSKQLQQSVPVLEYYLSELENSVRQFNKRKDPSGIKKQSEVLNLLLSKCRNSGSVYTESGYMLSAFRTEKDSTLQPFSMYLPEAFDPSKTYSLFVVFHGSGEDETWTVRSNGREFSGSDNIIIGPRGRDLSSWYTGPTESDIVELIKKIKDMFKINKTVLYGFSMGGYGTWRFTFLHPELFDGAVIISGIPFNLKNDSPENDIRTLPEKTLSDKTRKMSFLVIHGTDDHSLDVKYTDEFIAKLEKEQFDIKYVRIPGGGHGNFKTADIVRQWLNEKHMLDLNSPAILNRK